MAVRPGAKKPSQYAKGPRERGFRRVVSVDLDDPRFDPVFAYAVEVAPENPVQDSIRDLLLQAVAMNASDSTIREAHRQAYRDVQQRVTIALRESCREIAHELELDPVGSEFGGVEPVNFIGEAEAA